VVPAELAHNLGIDVSTTGGVLLLQGQPVPCGEHAAAAGPQPELPGAVTKQGAGDTRDMRCLQHCLLLLVFVPYADSYIMLAESV
jgi:hypothetical protein